MGKWAKYNKKHKKEWEQEASFRGKSIYVFSQGMLD